MLLGMSLWIDDPSAPSLPPTHVRVMLKVMENQKDLVEVIAELKQVLCVKG